MEYFENSEEEVKEAIARVITALSEKKGEIPLRCIDRDEVPINPLVPTGVVMPLFNPFLPKMPPIDLTNNVLI